MRFAWPHPPKREKGRAQNESERSACRQGTAGQRPLPTPNQRSRRRKSVNKLSTTNYIHHQLGVICATNVSLCAETLRLDHGEWSASLRGWKIPSRLTSYILFGTVPCWREFDVWQMESYYGASLPVL